jgi:hypothetical protein
MDQVPINTPCWRFDVALMWPWGGLASSIAAIEDAIEVGVPGFAFGTRDGPTADRQEAILCRVGDTGCAEWLQPRGRVPTAREDESLTPSHPAQNSFGILPVND